MRKSEVILKKDGRVKIKYRYTDFIIYDRNKASYITRYRMWTAYRDNCIATGKTPVTYKQFKGIIKAVGNKVKHYLMNDPNGVRFRKFSLSQSLVKAAYMGKVYKTEITLKQRTKDATGFMKHKYWQFKASDTYTKELERKLKLNEIRDINFKTTDRKVVNKEIENKLDIFNDFT